MKMKVKLLALVMMAGLLVGCSTVGKLFPEAEVTRTDPATGAPVTFKGVEAGPIVKGAQDAAEGFGPWGSLISGALGLAAAAAVKVLNDKRYKAHMEAEHRVQSS